MPRRAKKEDDWEAPPPPRPEDLRCKKCRKPVVIGMGNQRVGKSEGRYCNQCWKTIAEENW
jgi:hypothetical protein